MTDAYAEAGVSIESADKAVELMKVWIEKARRPEMIGGIGGFAGLFDASALTSYRRPLLATSTDGVGTKVAIAQAMDVHDTIGFDLVGMVVDDLVVCGAEPLFMNDYVACGKVVPERMADIVGGIAHGCSLAGCALVGGEIAEHPGMLQPGEYDVAGTGIGVVEADEILGSDRVKPGDVVVAMGSSGLHSNGYSLARHALLSLARMRLDAVVPEFSRTLGEELLEPTRIYALDCLALIAESEVHAFAHVTGGGLASNLARVLPRGTSVTIDRSSWSIPPVFSLIADRGHVAADEMERTFNLGVGMVAVVAPEDADRALAVLLGRRVPAWIAGTVEASAPQSAGSVELVGSHKR
jgi:phosphoribosylformylglycinamidine cyclo-ligase